MARKPTKKDVAKRQARPRLPRLTERQFQRQVIQLARLLGWRVAHFRPAMTRRGTWVTAVAGDGVGFPDLVMVRRGVVLFVELKVPPNRTTAEQEAWLEDLRQTPDTVRVWTPADWPEIQRTLRG